MAKDNVIQMRFTTGDNHAKKGNRKGRIMGKNGENVQNVNFKSIAKLGLAIRQTRMANEAVGAFTNNRIRQRRVQKNMTFFQYGVGITKFGVFGAAYALGDLGYRGAMHAIDIDKRNQQARIIRDISGISARSNSRISGEKL